MYRVKINSILHVETNQLASHKRFLKPIKLRCKSGKLLSPLNKRSNYPGRVQQTVLQMILPPAVQCKQ